MIIRGNRKELESRAAQIIAEQIAELLEDQPHVVLGVPGGRSVSGVFAKLAQEDVDWEKVHVFMVDERLVPVDDAESNFLLVKERLADVLPEENVHPFVFDPKVPDKGTKSYQEDLEELGGAFDIVLVSSGEDGHIAGLYPQHHSVSEPDEFFITMDDSPKPPSNRMSSSRALIEEATVGIVLFFGEGKRGALQRFTDEEVLVRQCPAKMIASLPQFFVLTDQEVSVQDDIDA